MFDVTTSMERFMSEADKKISSTEKEVSALLAEAAECGLPVKQYFWLAPCRRADALRRDIARAKASAKGGE